MQDYTTVGIQKIAQQAAKDPSLIRCPQDGAVMRVLASGPATVTRETPYPEPDVASTADGRAAIEVDVECPACRRRAMAVRALRRGAPERTEAPLAQAISRARASRPTTA